MLVPYQAHSQIDGWMRNIHGCFHDDTLGRVGSELLRAYNVHSEGPGRIAILVFEKELWKVAETPPRSKASIT